MLEREHERETQTRAALTHAAHKPEAGQRKQEAARQSEW